MNTPRSTARKLTGPADVRDQRFLDVKIEHIEDGIEAVIEIARNWSEGRNLSRLHPGVSAQDYILAHVKHPLGRGVVVPLLAESNWSNPQIAAVAGVSRETVRRTATSTDVPVARPAETLGADGKLRPARVVKTIIAEVVEESDDVAFDPMTPVNEDLANLRRHIQIAREFRPDIFGPGDRGQLEALHELLDPADRDAGATQKPVTFATAFESLQAAVAAFNKLPMSPAEATALIHALRQTAAMIAKQTATAVDRATGTRRSRRDAGARDVLDAIGDALVTDL